MTILLAWSQQDAALYLETLKQFEHKPPDALQEQIDSNHFSRLTRTLTSIKSVNKTDVLSLVRTEWRCTLTNLICIYLKN